MGMVVAHDLEAAHSSLLLHPNLILRIDQETVALRLGRRGIDRQNSLSALGLVPQILQRHYLGNFLELVMGMSEQNAAALVRIISRPVVTDHFELLLGKLQRHWVDEATVQIPGSLQACFGTNSQA